MFQYLVRRILWAILLFIVVTFVTFVIFFMAPVAPERLVCGGDQARPSCMANAVQRLGGNEDDELAVHRTYALVSICAFWSLPE